MKKFTPFNYLFTTLLMLCCHVIFSQCSTVGNDFWMGFTYDFQPGETGTEYKLWISSVTGSKGTVSVPLGSYSVPFTVAANGTVVVTIPYAKVQNETSESIQPKGVHIVSDSPVSISASEYSTVRTETSLIMPTSVLGSEYYVMSYPGFWYGQSHFEIVATQNATSIQITPSCKTAGNKAAGTPFTISLDSGQVYLVLAQNGFTNPGSDDLTGSHIVGTDPNKKFAVFAGAAEAYVPTSCGDADPLYEELQPVNTWGKQYIVPPFYTHTGSQCRIVASQANTSVVIDGDPPIVLNAGQFNEQSFNGSAHCITADKPIEVAQYMKGNTCSGGKTGNTGDPSMLVLSSTDQFIKAVSFEGFNHPLLTNHHVNVVMKTAYSGQLLLDGAPVSASSWTVAPSCSGYSYGTFAVANNATHRLSADSGFAASIYGYGSGDESYANNLGWQSRNGNCSPIIVTLSGSTICSGNCSNIGATVSGGVPPYSYSWSSGQTTAGPFLFCPTSTTNYTVTIIDNFGNTAKGTFLISVLPTPSMTISSSSLSTCKGQSTTLTINGADTYSWNPSGGLNITTGNNVIANPISNTTYTVIGTYSITGCSASLLATVNVISLPTLTINTSTGTICYGKSVSLSAGGANTYTWKNGTTLTSGSAVTASPIATTTYTLTGTGVSGCTNTTTTIITVNPLPSPAIISKNDINCKGNNNGCATVSVSGGTPGYTYTWSNGATTSNVCSLTPLTHAITVTDSKACSQLASVTITQPVSGLSANVSGSIMPVNCNGQCTGTVTITSFGGTLPYTYVWSNGQTSSIASNLCAGKYDLLVTDANACTISNSVTITQPDAISLTPSSSNSNCGGSNGTASVQTTGGTPFYSYQWSNGATTVNISGLLAGTYAVTVSDGRGCSASQQVIVNNNDAPTLSLINQTNVTCNGGTDGSLDVSITSGATPYTYNWTPVGTSGSSSGSSQSINGLDAQAHSLIVTDANGCLSSITATLTEPAAITGTITATPVLCNGGATGTASLTASGGTGGYSYFWAVIGSVTSEVSNLTKGTYTVAVLDANACSGIITVTITQPPSLIDPLVKSTPVSCFGGNDGSATVTPVGGTPPYYYSWTGGAGTQSIANGLSKGTYFITVTDQNSCTVKATVSIAEPTQLLVSTNFTGIVCNGQNNGTAEVSAWGGTPSYTYNWSNGASTTGISNLAPNTYSITVTDKNACSVQQQITITEPAALNAFVSISKNLTCNGGNDAAMEVNASGGTPGYNYLWSNGASASGISNVSSGTYSVVVTDANACSFAVTSNVTITNPLPIAVTITSNSNASVCSGSSTTLTANASNATGYSWIPSGNTAIINVSPSSNQTYIVTATDNNGCTGTQSITITVKPIPTIDATSASADTAKCGGNTGGIKDVMVTGGVNPLDYKWYDNNNQVVGTSKDLSNVGPGTYTLIVTDANGCKVSLSPSFSVPNDPGVIAGFTLSTDTGEVPLKVIFTNTSKGAKGYSWIFGNDSTSLLTNPSTTYIEEGNYKVILTAYGTGVCKDTAIAWIKTKRITHLCETGNVFTPNGDGKNDKFGICGENFKSVKGEIFNRWGERIYAWDTPNGGWDGYTLSGKEAPDGTYFYLINAIGMDDKKFNQSGYVQVIR